MKSPRLIGVIHLPPLPGAPLSRGLGPVAALDAAGQAALAEAKFLTKAGFDALILENFGDTPFYKETVPPETVGAMSVIAAAVRESVRIPVGINVLRNDAAAALAIAAVTGCEFIRVNVLSGVAATDQGIIEGQAARLLRERERLRTPVSIFADVHVKHARTLSSDSLSTALEDAVLRAHADAVIVSGSGTGKSVSIEDLEQAHPIARKLKAPLYVGSGADSENVGDLMRYASGVIVSTALRRGRRAGAVLDAKSVQQFVRAFESAVKQGSRRKK